MGLLYLLLIHTTYLTILRISLVCLCKTLFLALRFQHFNANVWLPSHKQHKGMALRKNKGTKNAIFLELRIQNYVRFGLIFVPCIIRLSRNNQQYALIFTTLLFYILAPTCFGSSLPSSGSFLDPSELLEIHIEWVVYLKCITDKPSNGSLL
jgi:hypothetical protein